MTLQKGIFRKKVVKQVVFIRRKKKNKLQYMGIDTWENSEKVPESCLHGSLNYFYGTFIPVFLCPVIFICLVHSPYLEYFRIFPSVCAHLLAKVDPTKEGYRYDHSPRARYPRM